MKSSQKTAPRSERGDEASYVDDYASIRKKKKVNRYRRNYRVDEKSTREKMDSNAF